VMVVFAIFVIFAIVFDDVDDDSVSVSDIMDNII